VIRAILLTISLSRSHSLFSRTGRVIFHSALAGKGPVILKDINTGQSRANQAGAS
jgi:hypothetical protein